MIGPDSEGLQGETAPGSASAFGSSQCAVADVLTRPNTSLRGGGFDERFLVVGEAHGDDVVAGVVAGRSAGSGGHAGRIAYTGSLDEMDLCVYDKSMTNSEAETGELDGWPEEGGPECGWLAEPDSERFGCVWPAGHFGAHRPMATGMVS